MEVFVKITISVPTITSHHFYALPLAIIGSEDKFKPWIYSEFIQMYTFRVREEEKVDVRLYNKDNEMFKYEPLHEAIIAPKRLVYGEQIIDVYKAMLNSEQYIYDFVDKYYIKSYGFEENYIHDLLIYGYDDDRQMFYAYAYNGNKLRKFDIPYNEYIAAYNSEYMQSRLHITTLYRKKDEEFHVNINKIGTYLRDYLNGVNTYNRESLQKVELYKPQFGLNMYDELKYMIDYAREKMIKVDMPNIYCVYDHKRLMRERIIYLDEHTDLKCSDDLKDKFQSLEQSGNIFALLSMKLNVKKMNSMNDYNHLMKRIDILKETEEEAYNKYYEYNRSVFENV